MTSADETTMRRVIYENEASSRRHPHVGRTVSRLARSRAGIIQLRAAAAAAAAALLVDLRVHCNASCTGCCEEEETCKIRLEQRPWRSAAAGSGLVTGAVSEQLATRQAGCASLEVACWGAAYLVVRPGCLLASSCWR